MLPEPDCRCIVAVDDLRVMARIGVHAHEQATLQPLVLTIELEIDAPRDDDIAQVIDYREIVRVVELLAQDHIILIETFARQVALSCLADPRARRAEVTVAKPRALAPALASARITMTRPQS